MTYKSKCPHGRWTFQNGVSHLLRHKKFFIAAESDIEGMVWIEGCTHMCEIAPCAWYLISNKPLCIIFLYYLHRFHRSDLFPTHFSLLGCYVLSYQHIFAPFYQQFEYQFCSYTRAGIQVIHVLFPDFRFLRISDFRISGFPDFFRISETFLAPAPRPGAQDGTGNVK